jgi:hypothetical protein
MSLATYGSYAHDVNSVGLNSFTREYIDGPSGFHKLLRTTIDIEAKIIRSSQLANFAELELMRAAYSIGGQSFGFYDESGNVLSWSLDSSQCVGGVTVLKPVSHSEIKGSHGVNWIKCNIVLQGDVLLTLGQNQYLTFQETLTFSGTGKPIKVLRTPAQGKPFKQTVTENSWFRATQSGSFTTTDRNAKEMQPIWPNDLDGNEGDTQVTIPGGITTRGSATEWSRSWSYQFSSPDPFTGQANTY